MGINRAVDLIAQKKAGGGRRGRGTPAALKDLGDHPDGGGKVTVREGRYGPYVNYGKVNATLPRGADPQAVTMAEALELIAARAGKAKPSRTRSTKKTTTKAAGDTKPKARPKRTKKVAEPEPVDG